jgi:hypothetical protein
MPNARLIEILVSCYWQVFFEILEGQMCGSRAVWYEDSVWQRDLWQNASIRASESCDGPQPANCVKLSECGCRSVSQRAFPDSIPSNMPASQQDRIHERQRTAMAAKQLVDL